MTGAHDTPPVFKPLLCEWYNHRNAASLTDLRPSTPTAANRGGRSALGYCTKHSSASSLPPPPVEGQEQQHPISFPCTSVAFAFHRVLLLGASDQRCPFTPPLEECTDSSMALALLVLVASLALAAIPSAVALTMDGFIGSGVCAFHAVRIRIGSAP